MSLLPQPVGTSDALVLRTWPTGETSVIASLLTATHGFVSVLARAARRLSSPLQSLVQPGRLVEVEYSLMPRRDLQYLRGGRVLLDPLAILATLERSAFLQAGLEIVDRCRPAAEHQGRLYTLCADLVRMLSCATPGNEASLFYAFELALLTLQGVGPALDSCTGCGVDLAETDSAGRWFSHVSGGILCGRCAGKTSEARSISPEALAALQHLALRPDGRLQSTDFTRAVGREIGTCLHRFLGYHLPGYRLPAALELLRPPAPHLDASHRRGNEEN